LRLRVYPDPVVDLGSGDSGLRVEIGAVTVQRRVAVPGEMVTASGRLGPRSGLRAAGAPASAWIVDLEGDDVPVSRIQLQVSDASFVRDYHIEWGGPAEEVQFFEPAFRQVSRGTWRRRTGEEPKSLVAEFPEVRASRLRLVVIDHGNPPLKVEQVKYLAAARQVVLPRTEDGAAPLRLYYGNADAEAPRYDFERNLPAELQPEPVRTELGPRQANPVYEPEPLPLTERWPWLIYVVLGSVSLLLAGLLLSVGGAAVRQYDRQGQASG
jgi:hypothetical protein